MMKPGLILSLFGFLIFLLIACLPAAAYDYSSELDHFSGKKGIIKIAGGTAHIPVMKEAARRIMRMNPDISITIAGGGSGVGIKQVGEGLVDIGNSGRKATDDEIRRYGLKMFKFAIDGIAVILNPENPSVKMNSQQLMDIFSGKINSWETMGWKARGINVYSRDTSSGTRKIFWKKALNKANITKTANFIQSNGAMKSAISLDPYGIGYISAGHIDRTVTAVSLDGVAPSIDNVRNGSYKIARGLYMNTRGEPEGLTKLFIDYILSREGQEIAGAKGFIPIK